MDEHQLCHCLLAGNHRAGFSARSVGAEPTGCTRRSGRGNAAAPEKSLCLLFWGAGVFVLPVIAIYAALVYWLFRGKLHKGYG